MKGIITTIYAGFTLLATAQTPLIAHKSHAGSSASYFVSASSNFGDNPQLRDYWQKHYMDQSTFTPLNDSTIILQVKNLNQQVVKADTLSNKSRYSLMQFQIEYLDSIRKERLKLYEEELRKEGELMLQEEEQKKQLELKQQQINDPSTTKKKEKKSYLLFLFGITGGGMLLMRLFGRSDKSAVLHGHVPTVILVIIFSGVALSTGAQTAIIAHKSHSGTAADFSAEAFGNFGIPSRKMVQIVYVNDSTTLNIYTRFGDEFEADTIHSPISYNLNIDSIKTAVLYLRNVEYVNFKHSPKSAKSKIPAKEPELENSKYIEANPMEQPNPLTTPAPSKKKKKSYLLFLFGITGGGMLLLKLFGRSKKNNPSIA